MQEKIQNYPNYNVQNFQKENNWFLQFSLKENSRNRIPEVVPAKLMGGMRTNALILKGNYLRLLYILHVLHRNFCFFSFNYPQTWCSQLLACRCRSWLPPVHIPISKNIKHMLSKQRGHYSSIVLLFMIVLLYMLSRLHKYMHRWNKAVNQTKANKETYLWYYIGCRAVAIFA